MVTLDGVMQAPGGPEEDTSGDFKYGGWSVPYRHPAGREATLKQMRPADYLLGRITFENFESFWPSHTDFWPGINDGTKYVLSKTRDKSDWKNTVFIESLADIEEVKSTEGFDLQVWGSTQLLQLLLHNDLVDELWLKIVPLTLGEGKKLFGSGPIPAAFKLAGRGKTRFSRVSQDS